MEITIANINSHTISHIYYSSQYSLPDSVSSFSISDSVGYMGFRKFLLESVKINGQLSPCITGR